MGSDRHCVSQRDETHHHLEAGGDPAHYPAVLQAAQNIGKADNLNDILEYLHTTVAVMDVDHDREFRNELCVSAISFCLQLLWGYESLVWAARSNTWLLIKLTPKGVVFSFSFLFYESLE